MKITKMAMPFTIWTDPHYLRGNIAELEYRIAKNVTEGRSPTDLGPLYLDLRKRARVILRKYNAQGTVVASRPGVRNLLERLNALPLKERFGAVGEDIRTLEDYERVHETFRLVRLAQDGSYRHFA